MGATIKAKNVNGDFTLLELDQAPPAGSVFMGWNSEEIATTSGVRLHRVSHPKGARRVNVQFQQEEIGGVSLEEGMQVELRPR